MDLNNHTTCRADSQCIKVVSRRLDVKSIDVSFDPSHIGVHPVLQEVLAAGTNLAVCVKQSLLGMNECFRLAERRHIQVSEDIAQMLLRHGGADDADRCAQHTRRLARPGALAIRARSMIDCIPEYARHRTIVFRCNEQQALCCGDLDFQPLDGIGLMRIIILVIEWQIADFNLLAREFGWRQFDNGVRLNSP